MPYPNAGYSEGDAAANHARKQRVGLHEEARAGSGGNGSAAIHDEIPPSDQTEHGGGDAGEERYAIKPHGATVREVGGGGGRGRREGLRAGDEIAARFNGEDRVGGERGGDGAELFVEGDGGTGGQGNGGGLGVTRRLRRGVRVAGL